ncbi:MAG: hypothetical protein AB1476_03970 [Candidatus Hadarchaeota archaeon]
MRVWIPKWAVEVADGELNRLMRVVAVRHRPQKRVTWLCAS